VYRILQISLEQLAGVGPRATQLLAQGLRTVGRAAIVQCNIESQSVQVAGDGAPNPPRTAGDYRDFFHSIHLHPASIPAHVRTCSASRTCATWSIKHTHSGIRTGFMLENIGYLAAVLTTFSFLPQAVLTLRTRKTDEISLIMYLMLNVGIACWLVYGLVRDDLAIILANSVTLLFSLPILLVKGSNKLAGRE
jgi:MtN3 and saliva related transmembrane protein